MGTTNVFFRLGEVCASLISLSSSYRLVHSQVAQPKASLQSPGGVFTIGESDSSLYSGAINYVNIPPTKDGYWLIPIDGEQAVAIASTSSLMNGGRAQESISMALRVIPQGNLRQ